MKRAAKIDANQPEIVAALRKVGASVRSLAAVGKGCPDLLVGFRGANYLIEVKDGEKQPSARALTKKQRTFFYTWEGHARVALDVDEALRIIGAVAP